MKNQNKNFTFVSKTIFFPKKGILAVGDLHLGYDEMIKDQGINLLFDQSIKKQQMKSHFLISSVKKINTLKPYCKLIWI